MVEFLSLTNKNYKHWKKITLNTVGDGGDAILGNIINVLE